MRTLIKNIAWFLNVYVHHGIMGYVSFIYPCYFQQDLRLINNGYDIITIRKNPKAYTRATYFTNEHWN
jgi:hypothetical protein